MLAGIEVQHLFQALQHKNIFTGFTNFKATTCFLNVVLQLFCHTDVLQVWMDADPRAMPGLKNHLADIVKWQGKYECIAPVEVLQCILASFENYGILATQNDVTELLAIMHDKMKAPEASERLWCMFLDHMDAKTYVLRPADRNSSGEAAPVSNTLRSISEYLLEILQPLTRRPLEVPAERILITKSPS